MRILITGGAGFIGTHLSNALLAKGHEVQIIDNLLPQVHGTSLGRGAKIAPGADFIHGDVCDIDVLRDAVRGAEAIYHFAAETGVGQSMYEMAQHVRTNALGTATLIDAISREKVTLKKLILASSRAVYGEGSYHCDRHGIIYPKARPPEQLAAGDFELRCPTCSVAMTSIATEEDRPLLPLSVYGWSKAAQEDLLAIAAHWFGIPVVNLRYFNVYGRGQSLSNPYTGIIPIFMNLLLKNEPIHLYENGLPARDFVHVADIVRANLLALDADLPTGIQINVGTGQKLSVKDIVQSLGRAVGRKPVFINRGEYRVGDIFACYADLSRAKSLLGYAPEVTLDAGLADFVAWVRNDGADGERGKNYEAMADEMRRHGVLKTADSVGANG